MIDYVTINSESKVSNCFLDNEKVNIKNVTLIARLNEKTNKVIWLDESFKNKERGIPVISINFNKKLTIGDPKGIYCIGHLKDKK